MRIGVKMNNTIEIGYHKRQLVTIEYALIDGSFSASGNYWNIRKTDVNQCGQIIGQITKDFPKSEIAKRIYNVWKEWHLNDMAPGSPAQEAAILEWKNTGQKYTHTRACCYLEKIGLLRDESFQSYKYGSAWLKVDLPRHIIKEILSWSEEK